MDENEWIRPEGALIDMKLKTERLELTECTEFRAKLRNLSDAELLAWAVELKSRLEKRLEHIKEACVDCDNEGTEDEDNYVLDEQKFNDEKLKINADAKKLLLINFDYLFEPVDDLYEVIDVK